jgi:hypothetical protein
VNLELAIEQVHDAESELVRELERVGEAHKADHDIHHLGASLSDKARTRIERLAAEGERHGASLNHDVKGTGPLAPLREKASELAGRRPEGGLLLLRDLRRLHLASVRASIDWVVLAQAAQAARDEQLLGLVSECHPQVLQVLKWTTTRIKQAAPQALA